MDLDLPAHFSTIENLFELLATFLNMITPLSAIKYLIRHIFLPPKLPGKDDSSPDHDGVLLDTTIDAL
ncbi:hypothetical protein A1O3_06965 [Capronia epimyces CBS 606.96]|uniref:DUF6606 domain-containing protein n=1 Tax=Capronia epimyces CBS 606.96 TaxID=1182542 RepID=W9XUJ4_9EURO|nr:uncharacterized protein A1O3_06965 [Capronia epimyces CBS 606.96]EXJ80681.1 hypothetical protein A1O3_06965 [Capronia epimyces CBS 606.96]